jgi:predicted metal-dependent peptidase
MSVELASERIKNIITEMIFKDSYWGYLFSKINRAAAYDLEAPLGVQPEMDGSITLVYNPLFVDLCRDDFLRITIEHEGIHILNHHIPRLLRIISDEVEKQVKKEKANKWNYAADCAVNTIIPIEKSYFLTNGFEYKLIFPEKYKLPPRKTSEFYFENIPEDQLPPSDGEQFVIVGPGDGKDGKNKSGNGNGNGNIDDHGSWVKNISKVADVSSLASRMEQYTNSAIEESYNNVRRKGNLPGYIQDRINEILKPPQIPYYQMIAKLVKGSRLSKQKRAYTRINKKRVYTFFIDQKNLPIISPFPGKTKDFSFNICILLDTSGSMSLDDIMEGLSGVKNIIENDKHCKTTIIECDTVIHQEYEVKRLKDIQYQIHGRGGTQLFPGLSRAKELATDVTLVFTDGYCDNINEINRILLPRKIIYVITKDGDQSTVDMTGFVVRLPRLGGRKYE